MMKAKELKFHTIQGNAPEMRCNFCGRRGRAWHWRMADMPLADDTSDTVSIVVCSLECEDGFKSHSRSDDYIADLFARVLLSYGN